MIGKQVLLVEDDLDIQHFVRTVLSLEGATLTVAATGADALALFGDGSGYDLMMLDLTLPDISGWEVLRQVEALVPAPRCKVVIFSATADAGSVRRAAEGGVSYITKPVDARRLVRTVKRLLRSTLQALESVSHAWERLDQVVSRRVKLLTEPAHGHA